MKILKNPIFTFILGIIITGSIEVFASGLLASQVTYDNTNSGLKDANDQDVTNVQGAIDILYTMANKTPTQVATLTTQGASYTMQNDGYIVGSVFGDTGGSYGVVFFGSKEIAFSEGNREREISLYAPKDTIIRTRTQYGTYNLTVYEWK